MFDNINATGRTKIAKRRSKSRLDDDSQDVELAIARMVRILQDAGFQCEIATPPN